MRIGRLSAALLMAAGGLWLAACGETASDGPSVSFSNLEDGDVVQSPVEVCFEVSDLTIEPSGEVNEGAGHHHILVDPNDDDLENIEGGSYGEIPADETHIHMGDGSECKEIELSPGTHRLMAVVADGLHVPLNPAVTAMITVEVE